ncbi:zinc finger protein 706 isoform X1 [Oryzias latipes]|uniref:Zinc finger protein 706 n=2 Tax=Oryzias latipes TaxID=8090 RepID=H2LBI7_ORYLA|nr:zinc finger protein 706 isoform X1 [Oryzias latipes]
MRIRAGRAEFRWTRVLRSYSVSLLPFCFVIFFSYTHCFAGVTTDMARGHQKFQSQQKNAKKQAEIKKTKGHDQKAAAKAALVYTCAVCRTQMPDPKTFKQHFESKHPKSPLPPELAGVEA